MTAHAHETELARFKRAKRAILALNIGLDLVRAHDPDRPRRGDCVVISDLQHVGPNIQSWRQHSTHRTPEGALKAAEKIARRMMRRTIQLHASTERMPSLRIH